MICVFIISDIDIVGEKRHWLLNIVSFAQILDLDLIDIHIILYWPEHQRYRPGEKEFHLQAFHNQVDWVRERRTASTITSNW